jgi:hypothetical protein
MHRRGDGELVEAVRFDTLRPDAIVGLAGSRGKPGLDILIELDDRVSNAAWQAKLERYDHFLSGWSAHTARYGPGGRAAPLVVVVCRDRNRARAAARRADPILLASRAYAGDYPASWQYPGREQMLFAAERDLHESRLNAYGVPALPPQARVGTSTEAQAADEPSGRLIELPEAPTPTG